MAPSSFWTGKTFARSCSLTNEGEAPPRGPIDLKEGKAFYRGRSPLAALAFAQHVDMALARIAAAPLRYPEGEYGTRDHVLPTRFPYTIVYRVRENVVVVVAVAHHSRAPHYWKHRQ